MSMLTRIIGSILGYSVLINPAMLIAQLINGIIGFLFILDAVVYVSIANDTSGIYSNIPVWALFIVAIFIILGFALAIYITFYIPIKLYQINKNTKKIVTELEKLNETKNSKISKDEYIDIQNN